MANKLFESQIQKQIIQWCKLQLRDDIVYWHTPNGELRNIKTAVKLKSMGALAGVPDLVFMWEGYQNGLQCFFVEIKRTGKDKQSINQLEFAKIIPCAVHVVSSLDEFITIAKDFRITKSCTQKANTIIRKYRKEGDLSNQ